MVPVSVYFKGRILLAVLGLGLTRKHNLITLDIPNFLQCGGGGPGMFILVPDPNKRDEK
jgi:hypothetical protein